LIENYGALTLLNSSVSGLNSINYQPPIMNSGNLLISNSTISNNSNYSDVGAIWNSGILTLTNSTLSGNQTVYTDGGYTLFNSGTGTLYWYNTLVANTLNNGGVDCFSAGVIAASINNLTEDGSCSPALSGDPLLGPVQYNGGYTPSQALLPGSPAIDAGDGATCLPTDQRDYLRPQDGDNDGTAVCDIGAFEAFWPFTFNLPSIFRLPSP
jgi:hypothetical protein